MVKLSPREQKAYKEELEHAANMQQEAEDAAYRRDMEAQYDKQPPRRTTPTAYERIKGAVGNAGRRVANTGRVAYDAGAQAAQTGRDIGQNPHIQSMRRQDGFTAPVQAVPRHQTSRQEYPGAPVTDNSVMHPGNRLVVMKCNDATGKCRTIATGISMEKSKEPRQARQRPWQRGGLGGEDTGF